MRLTSVFSFTSWPCSGYICLSSWNTHTHTHTLISVFFFSYNSQRLYKDWNFLSPKCISAKFANFWIGFVYNTALFGCFLQTVVLPFHSLSRVYQFYQSFQRSNFWLCWYFSVVYWLSMKIFFLSLTLPSLFSFDLVYAFFFTEFLEESLKQFSVCILS